MTDELRLRVAAIPGRHRGGWIEGWPAYAEWLEQQVAALQEHQDAHLESIDCLESVYRALPRARQRPAQRLCAKESRRCL